MLLALALLSRAWIELMPMLSRNPRTTVAVIGAMGALACLAGFGRQQSQVRWFCLLTAAGQLILPLWCAVLASLAALPLLDRGWRLAVVLAGLLLAGFVGQALRTYGLSGDVGLAVLQSNPMEVADFVAVTAGKRLYGGFLVLSFVFAAYAMRGEAAPAFGPCAAPLLVFAILSGLTAETIPQLKQVRDAMRAQAPLARPVAAPMPHRDIDVVYLLGESTSRWHMQLYGYPYPTNPRLSVRRPDLVLLGDAISVHSHTVPSVSSVMLRPRDGDASASVSLLGRLQAAGIPTSWYSTQSESGPWDSPIHRIAMDAGERRTFRNEGVSLPLGLDGPLRIGRGFTADEDMARQLVADLADDRAVGRFRVAQFTASHWDYCRLIPHEAREAFRNQPRGVKYFGEAPDLTDAVNCYDSAIRHVDALVDQVMAAASRRSRPTVVVFAPDHGEDPDGGSGHASPQHSARHIEIPVVIHANAAARQVLGAGYAALEANADKPFALPWLHETILDAFGVLEAFAGDSRRSLFSQGYQPQPRVAFDGALQYDAPTPDMKDYLRRTALELRRVKGLSAAPSHVFAHRNDSELALIEAMQSFEGVEMDVEFNAESGRFEVFHEPSPPSGFTLERALEVARAKPGLQFWLDWKNPSAVNIAAAVAELERLDRMFGLKARAWIETVPGFVAATGERSLTAHGFRHSHYLAPAEDVLLSCERNPDEEACRAATRRSVAVARQIGARYVSFDMRAASFGLSVAKQAPDLELLTWDLGSDVTAPGLERRLSKAAFAKVLLVRFPTRFWR